MALAFKRSWNTRIKEYFLDIAGFTAVGFSGISPFFDDFNELFNQETAHSFNDSMRIGLEALGYGPHKENWDAIGEFFEAETGYMSHRRNLNTMLREWATDTTAGIASVDFEEIQDLFDILLVEFGPAPPPVSINTALRAALASADPGKLGTEDNFDAITVFFEALFDQFGGGPVSIGSVEEEFAARYTFGNATQFDFEFIGADYDFIQMTFDGGNATGILVSFDREPRRFEMVN